MVRTELLGSTAIPSDMVEVSDAPAAWGDPVPVFWPVHEVTGTLAGFTPAVAFVDDLYPFGLNRLLYGAGVAPPLGVFSSATTCCVCPEGAEEAARKFREDVTEAWAKECERDLILSLAKFPVSATASD